MPRSSLRLVPVVLAALSGASCGGFAPGPDGALSGYHAVLEGDLERARRTMHGETVRLDHYDDLFAWIRGLQVRTSYGVLLHDVGLHDAATAELRTALDRIDATLLDDTTFTVLPSTLRAEIHTHLLLARLADGDLEGARVEARRFILDYEALAGEPTPGEVWDAAVAMSYAAHRLDTRDAALAVHLAALTWRLSGRPDEAEHWQEDWPRIAPLELQACPAGVAPGCGDRHPTVNDAELVVVVRAGLAGWSPCEAVEVVVDGVVHEALRLELFREPKGGAPTETTAGDTWLVHLAMPGQSGTPRHIEVRGRADREHDVEPQCLVSYQRELELGPGQWQLLSLRDDSCHPSALGQHPRKVGLRDVRCSH